MGQICLRCFVQPLFLQRKRGFSQALFRRLPADDLVQRGEQAVYLFGGGVVGEADLARRVPTVAITIDGQTPRGLAEALGERGIFCWDGNYYAITLMERLGLEETGGALRIGLAHYNTAAEVDRLLAELRVIVENA